MKDSAFLVLNRNGIKKLYKTKPNLSSGERGVKINVEMPDTYFDQPFPSINVSFDEEDLIEPTVDVQVQEMKEGFVDRLLSRLRRLTDEEKENLLRRATAEGMDGLPSMLENAMRATESDIVSFDDEPWSVEHIAEALEFIERDFDL